MARPGEKITRKTIMMQNKMKELDLKERSSKSLLANVLDMDDDFRPSSTLPGPPAPHPHVMGPPGHPLAGGPNSTVINSVNFDKPPFARITPGLPILPPSLANNHVGGGVDDMGNGGSALTGNGTAGLAGKGDSAGSGGFPSGVHRELSLILKELRVITDKIRDEEDTAAIENDWKFAAMVLDRLCLITFTLFTFVATIAVLLSAPHIIVT